ncbi:MAG: hypothetical protein HY908_16530 [Myxococcales bacterium]|nr:hypothetical protein [Myxococcales bacterium]
MSTTWREELGEACKSRAERDAEEKERQRKRVEEALRVADVAVEQAQDALRFASSKLQDKGQPAALADGGGGLCLTLSDQRLAIELDRATAVVRVLFNEARPREFDFAKDKHIAPKDVEEYVGRRAIELVRAAQKQTPW